MGAGYLLYDLISVSYHDKELRAMSDLNRGIMKFEGADKPVVVAVSSIIVIGSIIALILWAMKAAYVMN
jgi:hypothetical protein